MIDPPIDDALIAYQHVGLAKDLHPLRQFVLNFVVNGVELSPVLLESIKCKVLALLFSF